MNQMGQMELWISDLSIPSGDDQGFLLPFLESKDARGGSGLVEEVKFV